MPRDDGTTLRQLRDHVDECLGYMEGRERGDLDANRVLALALTHPLEIIGEAAVRTRAACKARLPHVPWTAMADLRNRLIHGRDSVNLDIAREVLTRDLPDVRDALRGVLRAKGID